MSTQQLKQALTVGVGQAKNAPGVALTFSQELDALKPELLKVLPQHVSADRFMRVVNTAISQNPKLFNADRRSLFTSCVKCAQDGLVPDGREAALTIFRTRDGDKWIDKVQYLPMVFGVLKLMRNSGEVKSVTASAVYTNDTFRHWLDDAGEHITFEEQIRGPRGDFLCAFTRIETHDGGIYISVRTREQIDKVMAVSKSRDKQGNIVGPWKDWYDEMAIKTVIHYIAKRAPMSQDVVRVVRRDEEMYQLQRGRMESTVSAEENSKALLGLSAAIEDNADGQFGDLGAEADQTDQSGADSGEYKPQFDKPEAIKAIKESGSLPDLNKAWASVCLDFEMSNREIDPEIDEAVKAQREFLKKV